MASALSGSLRSSVSKSPKRRSRASMLGKRGTGLRARRPRRTARVGHGLNKKAARAGVLERVAARAVWCYNSAKPD